MNLVNLYKRFKPSYYQALRDLTIHVGMLSSTLYAMWYTKDSYVSYALIPLVSLLQVKSFVIFHDCGHNSFTPSKKLNYILGTVLGITLLTPLCWTYEHSNHHMISGNKENKLNGDHNHSIFHSLNQYKEMNRLQQTLYKVLRQPFIFNIGIATFILFIVHRFHILCMKLNNSLLYKQRVYQIVFDTLITNICLFIYLFNNKQMLIYSIIWSIISLSLGFIIFHNQHTFNKPYVKTTKEWTKQNSGLQGSSFIQVPKYLKFFTYGIEYHHIHHMIASIPGYKLKVAHEYLEKTEPEFKNIVKLSMTDCYHNLWLTLYDEESDRYISFKEADEKIKNT